MQTLAQLQQATIEVKHSRFHAFALPHAQMDAMLARCHRQHAKANHYCTAARWVDEARMVHESAKDDGEPGGTAGRPMLRELQGGDWVNAGVIVVRYFGGTKLGTGGLARAYGSATRAALGAMAPMPFEFVSRTVIDIPFNALDSVERLIKDRRLAVAARDYHPHGVRISLMGSEAAVAAVRQLVVQ
jgi:uncharacterized YigZ family protein